MKTLKLATAAIVLAGCAGRIAAAAELQSDTLKAWDSYVKNADIRMRERVASGHPFLWAQESPERAERVRRGQVAIAPVAGEGSETVPHVEVREIQGYGRSDERLLPPDAGNGFVWRIRSMARFEERDGGVYLELRQWP